MRYFHRSISRSILTGIVLFGMVLIGASLLLSVELNKIQQQTIAEHRFALLLNSTLEIRRFEKNYMIFHKKSDFENTLNYVSQTEHLLQEYRDAFLSREDGQQLLGQMYTLLSEYRDKLASYHLIQDKDSAQEQALEMALHLLSQKMIVQSEQMATDNQDHISSALRKSQYTILWFNVILSIMVGVGGYFLFRHTLHPLDRLQEGLIGILEGRQELLSPPSEDQKFTTLTRVFNMTLKNHRQRQQEHLRTAQFQGADAAMVRLLKSLTQPMANISTTCQILLEEDLSNNPLFVREMLTQIRQQAEQGGRMLSAAQDSLRHHEERFERVNLGQLLEKMVAAAPPCPGVELRLELPADLVVDGHPSTLEQALGDLVAMAGKKNTEAGTVVLRGGRQTGAALWEILGKSPLQPLVWLDPEATEVVELTLPLPDLETIRAPDQRLLDTFSLCASQDEGGLGLCLLPGIIRQHGGAILVKRDPAQGVLFCLWLPHPPEQDEALLERATMA